MRLPTTRACTNSQSALGFPCRLCVCACVCVGRVTPPVSGARGVHITTSSHLPVPRCDLSAWQVLADGITSLPHGVLPYAGAGLLFGCCSAIIKAFFPTKAKCVRVHLVKCLPRPRCLVLVGYPQ
jgi:hypothetical protein